MYIASGQREGDKYLLPPQPWGSQGKMSVPPFLESLRPRNPALCVSPDCSTAAPSAQLPSLGSGTQGVVTRPRMKELLTAVAPSSQVGVSSTEQWGQCRPCWVTGQRMHIPELPPQQHLLLKEKEMEPRLSTSNFHTVQEQDSFLLFLE